MINGLKDCYIDSHITSDLPDIINSNNDAVCSEFDNIYDSTLNILSKSIYAPTGYVLSYFGDFDEIQTEYITVRNSSSFKATIQAKVIECMGNNTSTHSEIADRWSSIDVSTQYGSNTNLTHDASFVAYLSSTGEISTLYSKIKSIKDGGVTNFYDPVSLTTVTMADISSALEWKNSLQTALVVVTDDYGVTDTYKFVCSSIGALTYTYIVNNMLNSILGTTTQVPDVSASDIDNLLPLATDIYEGANSYTYRVNAVLNSILGTTTLVADVSDAIINELEPLADNIYNGSTN